MPKKRSCVICGRQFTTTGPTAITCSTECWWKNKKQQIYRRRQQRAAAPIPEHLHGTLTGYTDYLCRCDACKQANADYMRSYWQDRKSD